MSTAKQARILTLIVLLLTACQSATQIPPATVSAATPTASPTSSPTETPLPTETLRPTATITSQPSPTALPAPKIVHQSDSPDLRWSAVTSRVYKNGAERSIFEVKSAEDEKVGYIVEDEPFIDEHPYGFSFPVPFYWSKNGAYLYYIHRADGHGCFGGGVHSGSDLRRLDLATGQVEDIAPGGSYISISPNETWYGAFYYKESLYLQNLKTDQWITLPSLVTHHEIVGNELDQQHIVWSPDEKALMYVVMGGVCDSLKESFYTWLIRVDLPTFTQTVLLTADERGLIPVSWPEPNKVLFRDENSQLWWFNPTTKEFTLTK